MFASSGLQLSDATVGGRAQPDWNAPARPQAAGWERASTAQDSGTLSAPDPAAPGPAAAVRLVDIYA